MANVAKINGYDVKDAVARGDIADIQQDLSTAQGDITTLQGDVSDTKADLGDITALDTTVKTSAVNAINEVNGKAEDNADNIGTLANLTTTAKTDLVSAINEVNGKAEDNADNIGTLANLTTTAKTDLVSAINELDSHADTNTANFAPAFSDVISYAVGDYVTYNGTLYKCITAHTAGVWVAGHFTQVTVGEDLSASLKIEYTDLAPCLSTGWSVSEYVRGYKIGKMVIIDFCGLKSNSDVSAGQNQFIMQNLPYSIKNRAVTTLFSDNPNNSKKITVYVVESSGIVYSELRANYPALSASDDNLYGQMIIVLN